MAIKKITLKKRVGSTYDVLYPETKKANLLKSDGSALSTFGASVLETNIAVLEPGFGVSLTTTEDPLTDEHLYPATASEVRSYFNIAKEDHPHAILNITGLQTALDGKVPLVNSKIPEQYFPAVNADSMTFIGTAAGGAGPATARLLTDAFQIDTQLLLDFLDSDDDPKVNNKGDYVIAGNGYFTEHTGIVDSGKTFNFKFRLLGIAPDFEAVDDYQEQNDDRAVQLESGDRIVLTDIVRNVDTYDFLFDVINVNYSIGGAGYKGSAILSEATTRGEMSTVSNAANVVDEKVMRDVYKDVVYEESFTATFTVTENTVLKYATTNPTTSTVGDVDDRLLNITTASVYKCTVSNPGAQPASYTWIEDGSIPTFNRSTLDPATYYVFNTIPFVVPWNGGVNKLTQGTFQQLAPVSDDLVFAI
jgi:hypothetical protein